MWLKSLLNVIPMLMVMGYYLSFFFTISHNFTGVEKHEDTTREKNPEKSFLHSQVHNDLIDSFLKL
jgi:hypothetical protein